jgi:N-acyl-D-amino-acid deacylase
LSKFWRDREEVSLREAVRKMTGLAAEVAGIVDRGLLLPGYRADIVVFDPEEVRDLSTYREPTRPPRGIACVINNGHVVIQDGEHTGARPGRAIRRDWST